MKIYGVYVKNGGVHVDRLDDTFRSLTGAQTFAKSLKSSAYIKEFDSVAIWEVNDWVRQNEPSSAETKDR